jgi:ElaB/YqjD/DUF883 family membrane-anchored ribosome-binding protein
LKKNSDKVGKPKKNLKEQISMSEIKSTLDLVMERTKNMILSKVEKQDQEAETAKKHFNGALQKHLDGLTTLKELQQTMGDLQQKHPGLETSTRRGVLMEKIDLDALQGPLPDLLHTLFGCRIEGLKQLGQQYADEIRSKAEQRIAKLRRELDQQHQISGPAVLPNLEADPQWIQVQKKIIAAYEQKLEEEKAVV